MKEKRKERESFFGANVCFSLEDATVAGRLVPKNIPPKNVPNKKEEKKIEKGEKTNKKPKKKRKKNP